MAQPAPQDASLSVLQKLRPTLQRRSQEKLQRMLKAGRELVEQKGYAQMHIGEIVQRAGCSVGVFYERFGSKEAFFACMLEVAGEETSERVRTLLAPERWEGASAETIIREVVQNYVQWYRRNRGLYAAALSTQLDDGLNLTPFRKQFVVNCEALVALLEDRRDAFECEDLAAAVWFEMQAMNGTLVVAGFSELAADAGSKVAGDRSIALRDDALIEGIIQSFHAGLRLRDTA